MTNPSPPIVVSEETKAAHRAHAQLVQSKHSYYVALSVMIRPTKKKK
jgi:hypothetical protein